MAQGSFAIDISNDGNLFETVSFRMDGLEPRWTWWIEKEGIEIEQLID